MRRALAIAAVLVASDAAAEAPAARRLDWPGKSPAPTTAETSTAPASTDPADPRRDGARRAAPKDGQGAAPAELAQDFFADGAAVDLADPPPQPLSERDERRLRAAAASPDTPE